MVELDRPQMTIWRMHIACWITKFIHIHSEYVILTAVQLQQGLDKSASVLPYTASSCIRVQ